MRLVNEYNTINIIIYCTNVLILKGHVSKENIDNINDNAMYNKLVAHTGWIKYRYYVTDCKNNRGHEKKMYNNA